MGWIAFDRANCRDEAYTLGYFFGQVEGIVQPGFPTLTVFEGNSDCLVPSSSLQVFCSRSRGIIQANTGSRSHRRFEFVSSSTRDRPLDGPDGQLSLEQVWDNDLPNLFCRKGPPRRERNMDATRRTFAGRIRNKILSKPAVAESKRITLDLGRSLMRKAGTVRTKVAKTRAFSRRCWNAASRFFAVATQSGPHVATRKAALRSNRNGDSTSRRGAPSHGSPISRFRTPRLPPSSELPWRFLGDTERHSGRLRRHLRVLLVSHSACRTGAPLCLLKVAEQLSRIPDLDCWIVLQKGGELADSFAKIAPTLEVDELVSRGVPPDHVPGLIASRFHEFSKPCIAICNTAVVSAFHPARSPPARSPFYPGSMSCRLPSSSTEEKPRSNGSMPVRDGSSCRPISCVRL